MEKQVAIEALEAAIVEAEADYARLMMELARAEHDKRDDDPRSLADTSGIAAAASRLAALEAARDFLEELDAE